MQRSVEGQRAPAGSSAGPASCQGRGPKRNLRGGRTRGQEIRVSQHQGAGEGHEVARLGTANARSTGPTSERSGTSRTAGAKKREEPHPERWRSKGGAASGDGR